MRARASSGKAGEVVVGLVGEDVAVGEEEDAGAAVGSAVPIGGSSGLEEFPGDLEGDGGLAGAGSEGEEDAVLAGGDGFQDVFDGDS